MADGRAAVAANPSWLKAYLRLGAALTAAGQHAEAVDTYSKALKVDPTAVAVSMALSRAKVMAAGAAAAGAAAAGPQASAHDAAGAGGGGEDTPVAAADGGGEDLMASFMGEVAAATAEVRARGRKRAYTPGSAEVEVARLLQEHHAWVNLDPFLVLGLAPDAEEEEIKRHYRALSAVVHPDKCSLPRASEAFEEVKRAYQTLKDEERRAACVQLYEEARVEALRTLRRLRKRGTAPEEMPDTEDEVARTVRLRFAEIERKKKRFEKRLAGKAARDAEEDAATREIEAEDKADEETWDAKRGNRFNNWQGFKGGGKRRRLGGINNDSLRYGVKAKAAAEADAVSAADEAVFKSTWR